jgi:hypothetical protein
MRTVKEGFSPLPLIMVGLGLILMGVAVYWLVQTTQTPSINQAELTTSAASAALPSPEIKRVSLVEAKAAFDQKKAVFVDARGEQYFSAGHIPGAIQMSPDQVAARISELNPDSWIITYCT